MQEQYHILDCSYPPLFLLGSSNESFAWLPLLSCDVLLTCIQRFCESIPRGCQTKAGYINLIQSDFMQQVNQLIRSSTPHLLQRVSMTPFAGHPTPQLLLVCQFIHNWYGPVVASHLLCSRTRWNSPEVAEDRMSQPVWLQTPLTQIRSRLEKVNTGVIKSCCDLYLSPGSVPKLKTERYNLMIQRFRTHPLYLLRLSNVNFTKEFIALLPHKSLEPHPAHTQLMELLLRAEFGDVISEPLMSLTSSEIMKEKNKQICCEKHNGCF